MSVLRKFLSRIRTSGVRRPDTVGVTSMGRARQFEAYDVGGDTFIVEKGLAAHLNERPSVLIVRKDSLRNRCKGHVMTLSTGNHAVAALPLLDGRFWKLSALPPAQRSEALMHEVICANVVRDAIELSQREVPTEALIAGDAWLREAAGLTMTDVVMADRNEKTLEHFRRVGQEWRVKPLAWTQGEMRTALAAARKRIGSGLVYYHSALGVHFLTYPDFCRFARTAETDPDGFVSGLKELVGVYEGNACSFMRMDKYRGHHEVELFGPSRSVAQDRVVPELENLLEAIQKGCIGQLGVIQRVQEIGALYKSLLKHADLADERTKSFAKTLYMHITGEVYLAAGAGMLSAFDSRRTALPGATFVDGRQVPHPGADARTEQLLANLRGLMSKSEIIEYANVYELRTEETDAPLGCGSTREVVYKTSCRPLENSLVEKRLSRASADYGSYVLARVGALRAMGVALSDYYLLLRRRPGSGKGAHEHYIRRRCEGEPMDAIPASYFRSASNTSVEDRDVVLSLAALMGDAAAQNMAMKKYDPKSEAPLFGVGKEIYSFVYDFVRRRMIPKQVSACSIRGSFGWPSLEQTDANFDRLAEFYLARYAREARKFQLRHPVVTRHEVATRFMDGFAYRTAAMAWQLSTMRDQFEAFSPSVPARYGFARKWAFVLWSLERQERELANLRRRFFDIINESHSEG